MDKYLTLQQQKVLLQNAPQNLDKSKIVKSWVDSGIKLEGFGEKPVEQTEPSFLGGLKQDLNTRVDRTGNILNRQDSSIAEKGVQLFGQGAGLAANAIEKTSEQIPGVKQVFGAIGSGINWLATSDFSPAKMLGDQIGKSQALQEVTQLYDTDQNFKDSVDAVANIARLGGDVQMAVDAVGLSKNVTNKIADKIKTSAAIPPDGGPAGLIRSGINTAQEIKGGIATKTESLGEKAGAFGERFKTNVETKIAKQKAISKLPTEVERTAVRNGIDINDVTEVNKFFNDPVTSKSSTPLYKEIAETAKAFSEAGGRGTDPSSIVGKPMVERVATLNKQLNVIGKRLGDASEKLGNVDTVELQTAVMKRLTEVNGLQGIRVSSKGVLDFSDTTLASALSKADQVSVQKIFNEAVTGGTGKSKHLLRQELFQILGGKKSSGLSLTGTEENAYQAIRKALSDVLESKNSSYKTLSNEYRKAISPLSKIRKLLKETANEAGDNVDLLEMEAGLLGRRLTSNSTSGPRLEAILRELDAVGLKSGGSAVSTRNLQEFYNILNKYYDLSSKTGFQGQIKGAIEGGGLLDKITKAATGAFGETPAVRQTALENLLNQLLGGKNTAIPKNTINKNIPKGKNNIPANKQTITSVEFISPKPTTIKPKSQGLKGQ